MKNMVILHKKSKFLFARSTVYVEPNGDRLENCAVVWSNRNVWNDYSCGLKMCSFCELDRAPDLQIRGNFGTLPLFHWSLFS